MMGGFLTVLLAAAWTLSVLAWVTFLPVIGFLWIIGWLH